MNIGFSFLRERNPCQSSSHLHTHQMCSKEKMPNISFTRMPDQRQESVHVLQSMIGVQGCFIAKPGFQIELKTISIYEVTRQDGSLPWEWMSMKYGRQQLSFPSVCNQRINGDDWFSWIKLGCVQDKWPGKVRFDDEWIGISIASVMEKGFLSLTLKIITLG